MEELKNFIKKLDTEQEVYGDYDILSNVKEELLKIIEKLLTNNQ
jgi:hypothetical protein